MFSFNEENTFLTNKNKNMIEDYVAPSVEVINIEVERGYGESESNGNGGMNTPGWGAI